MPVVWSTMRRNCLSSNAAAVISPRHVKRR
jgi:hypothetical protein